MATKSAIGRMAKEAQDRLAESMGELAERFGVDPLDIGAIRYRVPALQNAKRLTALADWAEALVEATKPAPKRTTDKRKAAD